jgi:hypothetical protein
MSFVRDELCENRNKMYLELRQAIMVEHTSRRGVYVGIRVLGLCAKACQVSHQVPVNEWARTLPCSFNTFGATSYVYRKAVLDHNIRMTVVIPLPS